MERKMIRRDLEDIVQEHSKRIRVLEKIHNQSHPDIPIGTMKPANSKYQTNFIKGPKGNSISQGTQLIVKIKGAESVTGRISRNGRVLMIDQSTETDEDNNTETINFLLKARYRICFKRNLPKGKYTLFTWWWDKETMASGTYEDEFEII